MADIARLGLEVDTRGVRSAVRDLDEFSRTTDAVERKTRRATDSMISGFGGLKAALGGVAAALSVREIAGYADAWSDMTSRVQIAIGAHGDAAMVMGQLADVARGTYSSLEDTAEAFARNAMTLNALGKSTEEQVRYTTALNNALVVSGAKADRATSVQNSLSKALAEGALRGDDLNNVLNHGGRIAELLADELGANVTQLRALAADGKITGDIIYNTLVKNMELLTEEAAAMPATISDAFLLIRNSVLETVGVFDQQQKISEELAESLVSVADGIRSIDPDHLRHVADAAVLVAIALGSRMAGGATMAALATSKATFEAIRYQAALARMSGVSTMTAARLTALGVAAKGASAAMALVGGPAGAIMLAAGALAYFATRTSEADKRAMGLDERITRLGESFTELSRAQTAAALDDLILDQAALTREMNKTFSSIFELTAQSKRFGNETGVSLKASGAAFRQFRSDLDEGLDVGEVTQRFIDAIQPTDKLAQEIRRLAAEYENQSTNARTAAELVDKLRGRMDELAGATQGATGATEKSSEAFTKLNRELQERLMLVGLNSDAEKLAARISAGYVDGLLDGEGEILVAIQREIDAREGRIEQAKREEDLAKRASEEARRREEQRLEAIEREKQALIGHFQSQEAGYMRQLALLDATTEKESMLYEIQSGRLVGINEEQQKRLIMLAEEIDMADRLRQIEEEQREIDRDAQGIIESLMSEEEQIALSYERRREIILAATFETEAERTAILEQMAHERNSQIEAIERERISKVLDMNQQFFGGLAGLAEAHKGEQSTLYRSMFAMEKAFAVAKALMNVPNSFSNAYNAVVGIPIIGPALAPVAGATAAAAQVAQAGAIRSVSPSFDGGGYTGNGPRSGGLDGKGGFMAMMHPRETVIDHTKGQGMGVVVNVNNAPPGTQVRERQGDDGQQIIDVFVANVRSGGQAAQVMEQTYGMARRGQ